ncbi:MAG TPA: SURF1 family protein [Gemmatimonadaceae bacterium]|nr:SURF1 family protein [Gemmatimonadaceae bacterium]
MRARTLAFVLLAVLGAAVFVRLGVWQVSRLHERQARNATIRARLLAPAASIDSLAGPPDSLRYRRARIAGRPDYDAEALLVQRTHDGSPGVFLLTPVHTTAGDSATLVVRGWVYAPDGLTIDRSRWREGDSLTVEGYLDELPAAGANVAVTGHPEAFRRLDRDALARRAGVPLRKMYLWATGPAPVRTGAEGAARFTLPELDDGPHRSYAIQWFAFAVIALVGAGIIVRNDRRTGREGEREGGSTPARS